MINRKYKQPSSSLTGDRFYPNVMLNPSGRLRVMVRMLPMPDANSVTFYSVAPASGQY
jgi:hypothetical protein